MGISLVNRKDCRNCINASICGLDGSGMTIECNSTDSLHYNLFKSKGRYAAENCSGYRESKDESSRRIGNVELNKALPYMLAGKSEFVLHSTKTNQDFCYRLNKKEKIDKENEYIYFLNIKQGRDWKYAGVIWFKNEENKFYFSKGAKGEIDSNNLDVKSLVFVLNKLQQGLEPQYCLVYHTGKCGRCGKKLTTPESILTGLGPECCKKVGIPRVKIDNNI